MIFTGEDNILIGFIAGIVATAIMTLSEIPSWKKWGLPGVFEWHENQILSVKFFHMDREKVNFKYIFLFHFLNGSLAGIAFPLIISFLNVPIIWNYILSLSLIYGFVLWIVTLVPIHKPITGYSVESPIRSFTGNC